MLPVNPSKSKITTKYGVRCCGTTGRPHYWTGHIHKGVDFGAAPGTPVVAVWSGTVVDVSWGRAFGTHVVIDTDHLPDGSAGLWVGYMHLQRKFVKPGDRVEVGQKIGEVGQSGNTTGPHLHLEVQNSPYWRSTGFRDPSKHLAAQKYTYFQDKKVYKSTMVYGYKDSNSVRNVQIALNEKNSAGLPITGGFFDMTRAAVTKWQEKQGWTGADADGIPGPGTIKSLGLVWVDNSPTPPPIEPPKDNHVKLLTAALADVPNVEYVDGWDDPARAGNGSFAPEYVIMHHTAGTDSLAWLLPGGSHPTVAGANFLVKSDGTVHVLSAFKAYHAGKGVYKDVPQDRMNDFSWGIEIESLGTQQDMPSEQVEAAGAVAAALVKMMEAPIENIINHKTYSSTGKPDTLYSDKFWQDRAAGIPQIPVENFLTKDIADDLYKAIDWRQKIPYRYKYTGKPAEKQTLNGTRYAKVTDGDWTPPKDGLLESMLYVNCDFKLKPGFETGTIRVRAVRAEWNGEPEDVTAYQDFTVTKNHFGGDFLITHTWFEKCDGGRNVRWEVRASEHFESVTLGTRYTKWVLY